MNLRPALFPTLTLTASLLGGCGGTTTTPDLPPSADLSQAPSPDLGIAGKDIVDTAVAAGSFTTLVSAVKAAGLEQTLRGAGPFTVFAPNDSAFQKVPSFLLTELVSAPYKTELALILKYHVLSGAVKAADVLGKTQDVASVEGANLHIDGSNNKVVLNNGEATVITADVLAQNGVIHVIDSVLLPTLVDTAVGYSDGTVQFSTLVTALKAAALVDTLNGAGPFTVFAPSDAAFAALKASIGDAAFAAILADKTKLTKILTYHVLTGAVYAKDVATGTVATVEGDKLKVTVANGKLTLGDSTPTAANVVLADVPGRNGVIHVIDKVLLPPGL